MGETFSSLVQCLFFPLSSKENILTLLKDPAKRKPASPRLTVNNILWQGGQQGGKERAGRNLFGSQVMQCCCTSLPWEKQLCWGADVGPQLQPLVFAPLMPVHGLSSSSSPPTSWVSAAAAPCTTSSMSGISTHCPTYSGAPPPPSSPTCPSTCWQGGGAPICCGAGSEDGWRVPHADPQLSPCTGCCCWA